MNLHIRANRAASWHLFYVRLFSFRRDAVTMPETLSFNRTVNSRAQRDSETFTSYSYHVFPGIFTIFLHIREQRLPVQSQYMTLAQNKGFMREPDISTSLVEPVPAASHVN